MKLPSQRAPQTAPAWSPAGQFPSMVAFKISAVLCRSLSFAAWQSSSTLAIWLFNSSLFSVKLASTSCRAFAWLKFPPLESSARIYVDIFIKIATGVDIMSPSGSKKALQIIRSSLKSWSFASASDSGVPASGSYDIHLVKLAHHKGLAAGRWSQNRCLKYCINWLAWPNNFSALLILIWSRCNFS